MITAVSNCLATRGVGKGERDCVSMDGHSNTRHAAPRLCPHTLYMGVFLFTLFRKNLFFRINELRILSLVFLIGTKIDRQMLCST